MKRYALMNEKTGQYLSPRPSRGSREWTTINKAQLWSSVGPAVLAAKHLLQKKGGLTGTLRSWRMFNGVGDIKLIEFEMILLDQSIGFISKQQLEEQNVEIKDRKESTRT